MHLDLIRHAQSWNNAKDEIDRVEDPGLTDLGWKQAEELRNYYVSMHVDRLLTSAFRRALETAFCLNGDSTRIPEIWTELHEQGGCVSGQIESGFQGAPGLSRNEILREFRGFRLPEDIDEGGWWKCRPYESLEKAFKRACRLARRIRREFTDSEKILIVSHGTFIQLLIGAFLKSDLKGTDRFLPIFNASITTLRITEHQCEIVRLNDTSHLPGGLVS